jgi:hypothetical protein
MRARERFSNRGFAAFRGCFLVLLIVTGLQLAAGSTPSGAANPPGHISVTPGTVVEGSVGNTLTFSYVPGSKGLSDGTLSVKVPTGWTQPQKNAPGVPGNVVASVGKVVISNRLITVKNVTLCKSSCPLTLTYSDVTAPVTTGTASFPAKAAKPGKPLEPLPAPSIVIDESTGSCNPQPATASSGGTTMTVTPGTCLTGGTVVTITGSGFDPSSLGIVLQCNDASDQPTVTMSVVGSAETLPVSCSALTISRAVATTNTGDFPSGTTFTVVAGDVGPPCGVGDLVPTCPADSTGGNTAADAANYPCPPTPAQQAAGASCTVSYSDEGGKQQTVDISYQQAPAPTTPARPGGTTSSTSVLGQR